MGNESFRAYNNRRTSGSRARPSTSSKAKVRKWLELRRRSPRLIANAGDPVPPGAEESRIEPLRDLVERHGKF